MDYAEKLATKDDNRVDPSLRFAQKMCERQKFLSIQDHCRIYAYDPSGIYRCVYSPKVSAAIDKMIIESSGGMKFSVQQRKNIIANISALTNVSYDAINPDGYVNFHNGILEIETLKFSQHSPDYFFTTQLPYEYNPDAFSDQWEGYLRSTLNNDMNKILPLQEFCGYCFMRSCHYEKAMFLKGGGGTGKSTFTETFKRVIGKNNWSSVSLEHLTDPVLRCGIRGKYVNFDSDLPEHAKNYEEVFLKLSSGEAITFNEKFVPATSEEVRCKMIFNVNEFPYINKRQSPFYRRMILIEFENTFEEEQIDVDLKLKLSTPENLSGIFNWCILGLKRLQRNNKFNISLTMKKNIEEINISNNPILQFIADKIRLSFLRPITGSDPDLERVWPKKGHCVYKDRIWKLYCEWCNDNKHQALSFRKFNTRFYDEVKKYKVESIQRSDGDRRHGWMNVDCIGSPHDDCWYSQEGTEQEQSERTE